MAPVTLACYFRSMTKFSRAGLIVKFNDESVANTLADVVGCLEALDIQVVLDNSTRGLLDGDRPTVPTSAIGETCDLAVVIGGDGTLLHAARALVNHDVPIVGINRGRLGFLVDVSPDGGLEELIQIVKGQHIEEHRAMLKTRILRDGECVADSFAFNDTVIRVRDLLQIMDFDVIIDDVLVTHQRADGLIIATPSVPESVRVAEINKYPEIALDFGSDSRRGNGRIVVLCNLFHNAEAGPKDQQDWIDIFFRGPKWIQLSCAVRQPAEKSGSVLQ